ncbi:MAG: hypothetical protein IH618_09475 [Ignavibacteriaceae bacterium]|nr:hypothetical protein [Ignavibacteriaceae bacterium]
MNSKKPKFQKDFYIPPLSLSITSVGFIPSDSALKFVIILWQRTGSII